VKSYAQEKTVLSAQGKGFLKKCADDKKMTCLNSMPFDVSGQITIDFYRVSLLLPLS
jgi:hypothetical protein